jgi:hypothetical protein
VLPRGSLPVPPHVANQVSLELARPRVRFRRTGEGTFNSSPGQRFHVFDEAAWDGRYLDDLERYTLTDRAVRTTGCPNDRTDVVARTPKLKDAAARAEEILADEQVRGLDPHRKISEQTTPRELYYRHLDSLREAGVIDHDEQHRRLEKWDAAHCEKFKGGHSAPGLAPMTEEGRARIMRALVTDEELAAQQASERGLAAADAGRPDTACPYPAGSALERVWKSSYWRRLVERERSK